MNETSHTFNVYNWSEHLFCYCIWALSWGKGSTQLLKNETSHKSTEYSIVLFQYEGSEKWGEIWVTWWGETWVTWWGETWVTWWGMRPLLTHLLDINAFGVVLTRFKREGVLAWAERWLHLKVTFHAGTTCKEGIFSILLFILHVQ